MTQVVVFVFAALLLFFVCVDATTATSAPSVVLLALAASGRSAAVAVAFHHHPRLQLSSRLEKTRVCSPSSALNMALTPVGPFCPFRSKAAIEAEFRMEKLGADAPQFATEMARLQLDMQLGDGKLPDPDRLRKVADSLEEAVSGWEDALARLKLSGDFQTREYAKLTQAHLAAHDESVEGIAAALKWQAACMKAMADGTPPPMPPPEVDLAKLMEQAQKAQKQQEGGGDEDGAARPPPSMAAMTAAQKITETPFKGTEAAFDSPTVKDEYEKLCRDHMALIEFGEKFESFDPLGKIAYLDEIEKIQERWDIFFARFSLMGALNKEYVRQCEEFLSSMGLSEQEFRELLKRSHDLMREEAELQRNLV